MTRRQPSLDVSTHLLDPQHFSPDRPLNWPDIFGSYRPVELEVGSGKGLFLASASALRPGHNFLGIEISRKYARLAAERAIKRGADNVRLWPGDVRPVLARMVPEGSLHAVHVYFPDPWWKKRHKKRRVFTAELVSAVARALEPSGTLQVATDVEEYFDVIRSLLAAEPLLAELPPPAVKEPEHDLDYLTNFERKFRLEGRPIYRVAYTKRPSQTAQVVASGS
jgi:tRNA (guanine-N7-)-methyltransferase